MRSFIIPKSLPAFEIGSSRALIEATGGRVLWTDRKVGTVVECLDSIADLLELVPRGAVNLSTSGRKVSSYEVELDINDDDAHWIQSTQDLMGVSAVDTVGELSF